jgi:hypothetical protein
MVDLHRLPHSLPGCPLGRLRSLLGGSLGRLRSLLLHRLRPLRESLKELKETSKHKLVSSHVLSSNFLPGT